MENEAMSPGLVLLPADPAELTALRNWLETMAGVHAERIAGQPAQGEQGALDYLEVIGSSGSLIAAIKILPEFLRARRSSFTITTKLKDGRGVTLDAANVDDLLPVLERLLDDGT